MPGRIERAHHLGALTGAERQAAAERLGEDEQVGDDPPVLEGEEPPRAAEARHHLVEDEQRARLRAAPAQRRQESRRGEAHATLGLHGLDHHGGRVAVDGVERRGVPEWQERHVRQERLEGRPVEGIAAERECAPGVAVEAAGEGDEAPPPRVLAAS
jgi:hypothetical protein